MRYPVTRATPRNMRYALCDICGFKYHIKDLIKVSNKNNRKYGLLLCKRDYESNKPNPQDKPKIVKERLLAYPDKMRPESEDTQYITNPLDDRAPGKPFAGEIYTDPLDGELTLVWGAPLDQGSSPITGYYIEYSVPRDYLYFVLTANSGTNVPYFKDTLHAATDYISYRVAAINGFGQGPMSDAFYWPVWESSRVPDGDWVLTGNADYIITGVGNIILAGGV